MYYFFTRGIGACYSKASNFHFSQCNQFPLDKYQALLSIFFLLNILLDYWSKRFYVDFNLKQHKNQPPYLYYFMHSNLSSLVRCQGQSYTMSRQPFVSTRLLGVANGNLGTSGDALGTGWPAGRETPQVVSDRCMCCCGQTKGQSWIINQTDSTSIDKYGRRCGKKSPSLGVGLSSLTLAFSLHLNFPHNV